MKKNYRLISAMFLSIILLTCLAYGGTPEFRSLYVYGWGSGTFLNWSEVSTLVNTARAYNYNAVVPEIRKVGDAYYTSLYEPKANNPAVNDPSSNFDALSSMIQYAHDTSGGKKYIEVHAWMVADRIWKGSLSGAPSGHILKVHPEWMMYDNTGTTANGEGMYIDPGIPGAQDHQVKVWMDVVQRYDVDGVVLDYIRYPGNTWSYNTISIARFNRLYNRTGTPTSTDSQFSQFRRDNVTSMVKKLYASAAAVKPNVKISIDAIPWGYSTSNFYNSEAYNSIFQDWKQFMEGHFLDYLSPMIYDPDATASRALRYRNWNLSCMDWSGGRHVYVLQGSYMNSTTESLNQLYYSRNSAGLQGLQIYRYGDATDDASSEFQLYDLLRSQMFQEFVDTPDMPWKTSPTTGIFKGTITYLTNPVDGAIVTFSSGGNTYKTTTTDATGFYAIFDVDTSKSYDIQASGARWGEPAVSKTGYSLSAGQVSTIDIELSDQPAIAGFYATPSSGMAPLMVNFIDTSANNPTSWEWSFGDGSTSGSQSPIHIYDAVTSLTSYNVQLIASNTVGSSTSLLNNYITVYPSTIQPSFSQVPSLKLFIDQGLNGAFDLETYNTGGQGTSYNIDTNFLTLGTLSGSTLNQGSYSSATVGDNQYSISNIAGNTSSVNKVKYSTYKISKLAKVGLSVGESWDIPIASYTSDSSGISLPASYGSADALVVSDTTQVSASWSTRSTIHLSALSGFSSAVVVDVIASPVSAAPFGVDQDKERIAVIPNLLPNGGFNTVNDTTAFGYEPTAGKSVFAPWSQISSIADNNGVSANGILQLSFANSGAGIKLTAQQSNRVSYSSGQWYTARVRLFSPDSANTHLALAYNYSNEIAVGGHVDLSAYIVASIPNTWTWLEVPLYSNETGTGYPQLQLKAGSAGNVYVDEIQLLNAAPQLVDMSRSNSWLQYGYGKFNDIQDTTGWGYQSYPTNGIASGFPVLSVTSGALVMDFSTASSGSGLQGMKWTASNAGVGAIYTPANPIGKEVGVQADIEILSGSFNSLEDIFLVAVYGVSSSGELNILVPPADLAANGEFGRIYAGAHRAIGTAINPAHQFQFGVKSAEAAVIAISTVDYQSDMDDPNFGDPVLFP